MQHKADYRHKPLWPAHSVPQAFGGFEVATFREGEHRKGRGVREGKGGKGTVPQLLLN